jgi:hypothetical protein
LDCSSWRNINRCTNLSISLASDIKSPR